ncbi:DUF5959 family protein [Streptomyces sp. NPDC001970]
MGDSVPRELLSLADDVRDSVTVNVLGRDPRWAAGLDAEIVVRTPFASGRGDSVLPTSKPDSGAGALNRLDADEDVAWMEWDRGCPPSSSSLASALEASEDRDGIGGFETLAHPLALRHPTLRRGRSGLCR